MHIKKHHGNEIFQTGSKGVIKNGKRFLNTLSMGLPKEDFSTQRWVKK